jgi:hypothetical protein
MAGSSSSHDEQAFVIIIPVGLPPELHQYAPEFFLVVDSGATVHCVWDSTCTAHLTEQNSSIGWGGVDSRAVPRDTYWPPLWRDLLQKQI